MHHAYFAEGDFLDRKDELNKIILEILGEEHAGHPDYYELVCERIGIDDVRRMRDLSTKMPVRSEKRVFVLTGRGITGEAQNALLKTYEEPGQSVFFLVLPSRGMLLPTLRSRMEMLESKRKDEIISGDAKNFWTKEPHERLQITLKLAEGYDEPETRDEARARLVKFIEELEWGMARRVAGENPKERARKIKIVHLAREYVRDTGAVLKMIAEYLALAL